jgi:hypothetical protein
MPMPSKIHFLSDDNIAELLEDTIDESGGDLSAEYVYTKSNTKMGKSFEIPLSRINRLLGQTIHLPKSVKWVSKKSGTSSPVQKKSETAGKTTTELLELMQTKKKRGSAKGGKK